MKMHVILMAVLVLVLSGVPASAADSQESFNSAGAFYSQSVDLANEGKYQEALVAADKALALNVSSMNGLIQSNRAGILVMLHRNDEAITAADAALAVEGNLTTVHSIAWYNKGNALRALGRISEAQDAYDHASALDNTLVPPDMSKDIPVLSTQETPVSSTQNTPVSPTAKSPLSAVLVLAALGVFTITALFFWKK